MADTLIICSDAGTPDDDNRSWAEILVTTNGEVEQNGRSKFVLDRSDLDTCADQIRENGDKLPLDYDHSYIEAGSTVASGWFTGEATVLAKGDLRPNGTTATEDELWAEVEWTPQAAADIRSKRFRFISAEFLFAQIVKGVKRTVKSFAAATLTNRPFFNRMEAVTLSRSTLSAVVWDVTAGFSHIREQLAAALNPAVNGEPSWRYCICDIDVAGLKALVEDQQNATTYVIPFTLNEDGDPTPAPADQWVEAEEQWVAASHDADDSYTGREAMTREGASMDPTILKKSLGLADNATDDDVQTAFSATVEKASQVEALAAEVKALKDEKTEVDDLREQLKVERTKRIEGERAQIFSDAIRDGRMAPAEEEALTETFGENVDGLKKVIGARPKNATLAREQGSSGDAPSDADTLAEREKFEGGKDADAIDDESLVLHAKAVELLGKDTYTEDEYLAALARAQREETVTA